MSHETVEQLIPWFANGTLGEEERRAVEVHLRECAQCRALLDQAREQERAARFADLDRLTDEIHPRLLTEYAEQPELLDEESRSWIEQRLEQSAISREALQRLREVGDPVDTPATEKSPGIWHSFSAMFLRPAPALGYLVLLLVLAPTAWVLRDGGEPDAAAAPLVVGVTSERALRTDGASADPPMQLEIAERGRVMVLELETDLSAADLAALEASFDLEIRRADRVVWSESVDVDHFRTRAGKSVATITLHADRFRAGQVHEVAVRANKPGDPVHGQALFRRSFEFVDR